ncbi:MAG: hypothetical protein V1807_01040 [Patescibacteria group bacterium]
MKKVYWLSRHDLSPAQQQAIRDLHGEDVEVIKDPVSLEGLSGLFKYILDHRDGFVYAVAPAHMILHAALYGLEFGMFENHPGKRQDGQFGLKSVWHVICHYGGIGTKGPEADYVCAEVKEIWTNPDPMSDQGEILVPVSRTTNQTS